MKPVLRKIIAFLFLLISSNAISDQAETGVQIFLDLSFTHFLFDDGNVAGTSNHLLGASLAVVINPLLEIGYTDSGFSHNVIMDEDAGLTPKDGFFTKTRLLYLRRNIPISTDFSAYALIGHSRVEVEATSTSITCLFFCGDSIIGSSTTYDYIRKESGVTLGVGLQWLIHDERRVQLQYIDYIYNSESDFSGVYLSYGWMFNLPPF